MSWYTRIGGAGHVTALRRFVINQYLHAVCVSSGIWGNLIEISQKTQRFSKLTCPQIFNSAAGRY